MAQKALTQSPRPTAIFAANNFIAYGALKALREAGLEVPGAVAMVAFDDLPPGLVLEPHLTVASQPAYEMGRKATQLLLNHLQAESPEPFQEIILPTELIVRRSSGTVERLK